MITKKIKLSYEPEADVLAWEVTKQPIDYAEEVGNVVIHYSKKHSGFNGNPRSQQVFIKSEKTGEFRKPFGKSLIHNLFRKKIHQEKLVDFCLFLR